MSKYDIQLSVVVCTRDRPGQLGELLANLVRTLSPYADVEVVVADNSSDGASIEICDHFAAKLNLRHVRVSPVGKGYCLNQVMGMGLSGRLIAVLDDDMQLPESWAESLLRVSAQNPETSIFGGYVYPIWPDSAPPDWAKQMSSNLLGWTFSSYGYDASPAIRTTPLKVGYWPSGNHYWFRRELLEQGHTFAPTLADSSYGFLLDAQEAGHRGIMTTEVVAGHRLQPSLMNLSNLEARARHFAPLYAQWRLHPYRECVKAARQMRHHPFLGRAFCLLGYMGFTTLAVVARISRPTVPRIHRRLNAVERSAYYRNVLKEAANDPVYAFPMRAHHARLDTGN